MKLPLPTNRLSTVALVMLGWLVVGLALPLLVSTESIDTRLNGAAVSAASRHSYVVGSPIDLSNAPGLRLDRGTLYLVSSNGNSLSGKDREAALASGAGHIVAEGAGFSIGATTPSPWSAIDGHAVAPIVEAISRAGFESLALRRSTVTLVLPDGRSEQLTDVTAEMTAQRKSGGVLQIAGTGLLRGNAVRFEASTSTGGDRKGALRASVPLRFSVKGSALDIAFDGTLNANPVLTLQGNSDIRIGDFRQLARWFSPAWPLGPGMRDLRLRGDLDWAGQGISVGKAQFSVDGNDAQGSLTLKLSGPRPQVAGTLAFKTLDLSRYAAPAGKETKGPAFWRAWLPTGDMTQPLISHFDADVRVSTDRLTVGGVDLGKSASAITVKDGRLLADIADMEFGGGRGGGQIVLDYGGAAPRLTLRGKLEGIDSARAGALLLGDGFLTGRSTVVADIGMSGHSAQDLIQSINGKVAVSAQEGGRLGIDLRSLLAAAQKKEIEGWGAAQRSQTAFDSLEARFSIRNGQVVTDKVEAMIADTPVLAGGSLSLPTGRFDLRVWMAAPLSPNGRPDALILSGPLASPRIRSESASQAAEPRRDTGSNKRS